jgi:hypothetical protein
MAIFGIGAWHGTRKKDVTDIFLSKKVACVGWSKRDASALHGVMAHIKVGDIIYIKTQQPDQGLIIKAVGIVVDDEVVPMKDVGESCRRVKWIWKGKERVGKIHDKYNVRNITLYEEYNPRVQKKVIELLTSRCGGH